MAVTMTLAEPSMACATGLDAFELVGDLRRVQARQSLRVVLRPASTYRLPRSRKGTAPDCWRR